MVPVQAAAYVVVVLFMYLLVRRVYRRRFWAAVQWRWPASAWTYLLSGIALALVVQFSSALLPIPKSLPIEQLFRNPTSAYLLAVFGISFAPLVEELFFRGFLYPVVARRLGATAGIVLTAAAFAIIHESQLGHSWGPLLLLFAVGVVLTWTRARTQLIGRRRLSHPRGLQSDAVRLALHCQ